MESRHLIRLDALEAFYAGGTIPAMTMADLAARLGVKLNTAESRISIGRHLVCRAVVAVRWGFAGHEAREIVNRFAHLLPILEPEIKRSQDSLLWDIRHERKDPNPAGRAQMYRHWGAPVNQLEACMASLLDLVACPHCNGTGRIPKAQEGSQE